MGRTRVQQVANLYPGYFSLVMATGIVSIAGHLLGMPMVAWALFAINVVAYACLWILTLARLAFYRPALLADLASHQRGAGFFTVVAGSCVLGVQLVVLAGQTGAAFVLWLVGSLLWLILIYSFFTAVTIRADKPSLEKGLNGGWLLAVVSTQSIAVLGARLAPSMGAWQQEALFLALAMFLLGCMLYLLIISLIFYRFVFFPVTPEDLTPPYWISMGAIAITTLAGATLMLAAPQSALLQALLPFLHGFTLFFWVAASWWIPLLLVLGAWRHLYRRFPFAYDPQYWGMVFPLGMYTVCTFQLARAIDLPFLLIIPHYAFYVALAAWLLVFAGMARGLLRGLLGR